MLISFFEWFLLLESISRKVNYLTMGVVASSTWVLRFFFPLALKEMVLFVSYCLVFCLFHEVKR